MTDPRDGLDEAIDGLSWPFVALLAVVVGAAYVATSPWRLYRSIKRRTARA